MQLLKIRYYQAKRNLGILFFLIVAIVSAISFFAFDHKKHVGLYAAGVVVYLFYAYNKNRRDLPFLFKHSDHPNTQLVTEYNLFLLPVSVACLFTPYWYCSPIMHALVTCIPYLTIDTKIEFKFLFLTRLLKNDYIFIAGVRKNIAALVILLLVSLALSPLKLFPLVSLFLLNTVIFSFYDTNESVQMIQSSLCTPKQFLSDKLYSGAIKMMLINFPVLAINTFFNPDLFLFNLFFVCYSLLILASIICMKYADYEFKKYGTNSQGKLILMILGFYMPYLSILTLVFYFQSRNLAITNLNNYLDDQHS